MNQLLNYDVATSPRGIAAATAMAAILMSSTVASDTSFRSSAPRAYPRSEPTQDWFSAQGNAIKELKADWDSYGAAPIDPATVDRLVGILTWALPGTGAVGALVPGADGSIQAEWHLRKLSIGLLIEESGEISCWAKPPTAMDEVERSGNEAMAMFNALAKTFLQ